MDPDKQTHSSALKAILYILYKLRRQGGISFRHLRRYLIRKYVLGSDEMARNIEMAIIRGVQTGLIIQEGGMYRVNQVEAALEDAVTSKASKRRIIKKMFNKKFSRLSNKNQTKNRRAIKQPVLRTPIKVRPRFGDEKDGNKVNDDQPKPKINEKGEGGKSRHEIKDEKLIRPVITSEPHLNKIIKKDDKNTSNKNITINKITNNSSKAKVKIENRKKATDSDSESNFDITEAREQSKPVSSTTSCDLSTASLWARTFKIISKLSMLQRKNNN